jgi:hypothetical protein
VQRLVPGGGWALLALSLTSCGGDNSAGYVEIKALPPSAVLSLYMDSVKLAPMRNGNALLRQRVGTSKLQSEVDGGQLVVLCNVEVRKNRITSVTVSSVGRAPRCQCGRTGSTNGSGRTCIG